MSQNGKGSKPRVQLVSRQVYSDNYDNIFAKKKKVSPWVVKLAWATFYIVFVGAAVWLVT